MAKSDIQTFGVDGDTVVLKRVQPKTRQYSFESHPVRLLRSKYEVRVNDILRGYVVFSNGWGGQWRAFSLELKPYERESPDFEVDWYCRLLGTGTVETLARSFPRFIRNDAAPTVEEIGEKKRKAVEAEAQKKIKDEEDRIRWAREAAERKAEAAVYRQEMYEGLTSLSDRLSGQMTNLELLALGRAIEQWTSNS